MTPSIDEEASARAVTEEEQTALEIPKKAYVPVEASENPRRWRSGLRARASNLAPMFRPIITHHHIKEDYKRGMTPSDFKNQFLRYMDTHVFSFDDGLKDGYTEAFPLLKRLGKVGYFFPIGETLVGVVNHMHKGHVLIDRFEEQLIELWNDFSDQKFTPNFTNIGKY
ncbi:unnamed protein product, partial [marine sediment metagenome]